MTISLNGLSATALETLARRAIDLANDLRKEEPSYRLALEAGVEDHSYSTVRNGRVSYYAGEAIVTMANGKKWRCVGHRSRGDAYSVYRQGYIEFIPLD
ncbi:MAG: hypothetical protein EBR79_03360 [Proteobacteria bacterium]|nr:hypothetical protein [Pseudomonadota bacterium]NBX86145.1 hypothetical protein [Pseudomonadota bacterium]